MVNSQEKQRVLHNWRNKLEIQYRPAQLIAAFQHCFYALLTRDHAPDRAARPLASSPPKFCCNSVKRCMPLIKFVILCVFAPSIAL
ncbi:MAG: hypothetical protein R3E08_12015 [Thiotrichaceae bacterium]